jgi:thiamine-monophosphate kinase
VAARSGVELRLRLADLPLGAGVELMEGDAQVFAATGGDDYELLVTVSPERADDASRAAEAAGTTLTWLGDVAVGLGLVLLDEKGDHVPGLEGYEHA